MASSKHIQTLTIQEEFGVSTFPLIGAIIFCPISPWPPFLLFDDAIFIYRIENKQINKKVLTSPA